MSVGKGLRGLLTGGRFSGYTPAWIAGRVWRAALMSLVASALINLFLLPGGLYLTFWQLWLLVTAALLAVWFARPLREPPPVTTEGADHLPTLWSDPPADPYPIADRWARRLSVTSGDPEWFGRVARDRLAALVAERVWQRHGVRRLDRAILGDELYEFLTAPLSDTPTPAEMNRLITRMEQL